MTISKKQQACVNRYMSKNYDRINLAVKKGDRDKYKQAAEQLGMSVNQLFVNAVEDYLMHKTKNSAEE